MRRHLKNLLDERATDEVKVIGGDDLSSLTGKQVIVVEDIVDTGNTMRKLMNVLAKVSPDSVKGFLQKFLRFTLPAISVVSMLSKRTPLNTTGYIPDYAAFNVPNAFVVGYV